MLLLLPRMLNPTLQPHQKLYPLLRPKLLLEMTATARAAASDERMSASQKQTSATSAMDASGIPTIAGQIVMMDEILTSQPSCCWGTEKGMTKKLCY